MRAVADVWATNVTSTVIATRGERLALMRLCFSGRDQRPERFVTELLALVEINADERVVEIVSFDLDDIDAAFEELDARYLAGEAAAHSHTWSVIAAIYAGFNRHELPATTPDWVYIDHRPVIAIEASDLPASIHAIWDLTPDISIYIEAVHRLSDLGAVVTHTARGISHEDFDAEWRMIDHLHGRRRPDQPLRDVRRGRPGRRAREVRRAQRQVSAEVTTDQVLQGKRPRATLSSLCKNGSLCRVHSTS